jgi:hypothetical protein
MTEWTFIKEEVQCIEIACKSEYAALDRVADQLHKFQDWSTQNTRMCSDEAINERADSDFSARRVHRLASDLQMA